jgi:Epoxide hydrolase N terminus
MSNETEVRPFRVDMPEESIADLRRRIVATRLPSRELVADRSQGVQLATIRELAATGRPTTTGARARRG